MKKTNLKKNLFKLFIAAMALIVAISLAPLGQARQANAQGYEEFSQTVQISQGQFELGDLTTMPASPSLWTGDFIGGGSGDVKSGVLTLNSAYSNNHEATGLEIYDEYKNKNDIPITPFGKQSLNPQIGDHYQDTTKNVLMINNRSFAAYGYSSEAVALDMNSFYVFSAWVKTGSFSKDEGAAITLTGLKEPVGIWNIDTVSKLPKNNELPDLKESNNWGWREYKIYVATGVTSETVNVMLSVGDNTEDYLYSSQGYAFFANITAKKLSATHFYNMISGSMTDSYVYDMNSYEYAYGDINGVNTLIGDFSNGKEGWSIIYDEEVGSTGRIEYNTYNAGAIFGENKPFGFDSEPFSPIGKAEQYNNIMVLSSYQRSKDSFDKVQAGIKSPDITIEKESNYELSVWYNTQQIDGSAAIVISGESTQLSTQYKITPVEVGNLITDSNANRYGWQRAQIYIKGSILKDVKINVELWLGKEALTSGIAMFDDITLRKISSKEYNEASASSTTVIIDSGTPFQSGVANGLFYEADYANQDELVNTYPLTPSSWSYIDARSANLAGYSSFHVNTDNAIHGLMPTNPDHFNANKSNYGPFDNPYQYNVNSNKNLLLMYSPTPTVFGYRSSAITISAESYNIIKVKMLAECSGYGANLVLKNGLRVISTIEGIQSTLGEFREYDFYISGGSADITLTFELWFGLVDKGNNTSKQTSGYVFIDSVELVSSEESVVVEKFNEYNSINNMALNYANFAAYRLGNFDFSAYDRYSNSSIKDAYDFTLTTTSIGLSKSGVIGIINPNNSDLPSYYSAANSLVADRFNTTLYLKNNVAASSRLTSANAFGLTENTFYKIEFSVLVDIFEGQNDNAVGGGIKLGSYAIENIQSTLDDGKVIGVDPNGGLAYQYSPAFKTFTFYYATNAEAESAEWSLTLGDELPNKMVAGHMFCNRIAVTTMDSYYFDQEIENLLSDNDVESIDDIYGYKLADARIATEETEEETEDEAAAGSTGANSTMLLIPSILFAVAILIALVGVVAKKLIANKGGKRIRRTVSYDRNMLIKPTKADEADADKYEIDAQTPTLESFDDKDESDTLLKRERKSRNNTALDDFSDIDETESTADSPIVEAEKSPDADINEFDE